MNTNYYIPIYFQTNSYSAEKLVGGILFFSSAEVFLKVAENKIRATTRIGNAESGIIIRQTIRMLSEKIESQKQLFTRQYLEYLRNYSNGIVQFGEMKPLSLPTDKFDDFAFKFLGEKINLHQVVNQKLSSAHILLENAAIPYIFHFSSSQKTYKLHLKLSTHQGNNFILQSINLQNTYQTVRKQLRLYERAMREMLKKENDKNKFALVIQKQMEEEEKIDLLSNFKIRNPHCEIIELHKLDNKLKEVAERF